MTSKFSLSGPSIHRLGLNVMLPHNDFDYESIVSRLLDREGFTLLEPEIGYREEDGDEFGGRVFMARGEGRGLDPNIEWCGGVSDHPYILGAQLEDGSVAFVQLGQKEFGVLPHFRLTFPGFDKNGPMAAKAVRRHLRSVLFGKKLFNASRVFVCGLFATYRIQGLTLRELRVEHSNGSPFQLMVNTAGVVCGYQFGEKVGPGFWDAARPQHGGPPSKTYDWHQTRVVAVRGCWPHEKEGPAIEVGVTLVPSMHTPVSNLEKSNGLIGLQFKHAGPDDEDATRLECWESRSAWKCIVGEIRTALPKKKG